MVDKINSEKTSSPRDRNLEAQGSLIVSSSNIDQGQGLRKLLMLKNIENKPNSGNELNLARKSEKESPHIRNDRTVLHIPDAMHHENLEKSWIRNDGRSTPKKQAKKVVPEGQQSSQSSANPNPYPKVKGEHVGISEEPFPIYQELNKELLNDYENNSQDLNEGPPSRRLSRNIYGKDTETSSFGLVAWRIFLIIAHFANFVTDILTARDMFIEGYYSYFICFVVFFSISWLLGLFLLGGYATHTTGKKALVLALTQFDYAYLLFVDFEEKDECVLFRKMSHLLLQSGPLAFISVHSIFVAGNTNLTPQISIAFAIVDFSLNNALFNNYSRGAINLKPNLKRLKEIVPSTLYVTVDTASKLYLWGFFSAFTRPLGAWIYFPSTIVLWFIVACGCPALCDYGGEFADGDFIPVTLTACFLGNLTYEPSIVAIKGLHRFLELIAFGIIILLHRDEMAILLSMDIWCIYFYTAIVCAGLWAFETLRLLVLKENHRSNSLANSFTSGSA